MKFDENVRFMQLVEDLKIRGKVVDYVQLATVLGTNKAGINDIKNCRKKISIDLLQKMKSSYPDISLDWIIMGNGEMYHSNGCAESMPQHEESAANKILLNMIKEKDNLIRGQSELIGRLKEMAKNSEESSMESPSEIMEIDVGNAH